MKKVAWLALTAIVVGSVSTAQALDDEQKCRSGRAQAKGTYEMCVQTVMAKGERDGFVDSAKLLKCKDKYAAVWTKLQALKNSPSCSAQDRFVDNGNGTFTDRLTFLTWEMKSGAPDFNYNYADVHDPDNLYALDFINVGGDDDGGAYDDFLKTLNTLNGGFGFAGARGWRLPTLAELLTIYGEPILGSVAYSHWSTSNDQANPGQAWAWHFGSGFISAGPKWGVQAVRAVRGGL